MDMNIEANRTDCLHICHVDTDKLENGTASIVTVVRTDSNVPEGYVRSPEDEVEAMIDSRGFFRTLHSGQFILRDNWEVE